MQRIILLICMLFTVSLSAQNKKQVTNSNTSEDSILFSKIKYRMVGPFRGGRSGAITGDYRKTNTFFFSVTVGGVWKTIDGGESWFEADTDIPMPRFTSLIKIDSKDHLRIYAGSESETYFTSSDGGLRWSKVNISGVQGSLWSGIPKSPKNIHSTVTIGSDQFLGSLDGGVWKYENFNDSKLSVRTGLDSLQVWKLRAIEVK